MGICSICKKISATDSDHLHCVEKTRIELENVQLKDTITERLNLGKDPNIMSKEIKALLGHMNREKESK
ncbi:MAG: hypothetical protein O3C04_05390 [Crenarchaeota archaeon]|nr:hypothetical protein [Thermoproteota archaeon]MDA1125059.1 hypothetical protein [Thermoproteota archaeon]